MCQFVETICLNDGCISNLKRHEERFNSTRNVFGWESVDLAEVISSHFLPSVGKYKIRVVYGVTIELVECVSYEVPQLSRIGIVEYDEIDYRFKSTNRDCFRSIYESFPGFDDFIIVRKGLVTDSTFCNLAFLKDACWETPETPLLAGVQRSVLLDQGVIKERNIQISDLNGYSHISFFNALNEHGSHILPVSRCVYLGKFDPVL